MRTLFSIEIWWSAFKKKKIKSTRGTRERDGIKILQNEEKKEIKNIECLLESVWFSFQ